MNRVQNYVPLFMVKYSPQKCFNRAIVLCITIERNTGLCFSSNATYFGPLYVLYSGVHIHKSIIMYVNEFFEAMNTVMFDGNTQHY